MKTQMVEILITVAQDAESKLYDGDPKFSGEYILRALDADGVLLSKSHVTLTDLAVTTSDYARLVTLQAALQRLHVKLCGGMAPYTLRVVQSSKNVDGWLARGWKRNAGTVKELAGTVDTLLKPFPRREFIQLPRTELDARLSEREGVMPSPTA